MPSINGAGLAIIKKFEGCILEAYQDPVGIWTIGYGHTGPLTLGVNEYRAPFPGLTITQAQAEALLLLDVARFEIGVNTLVDRDLNTNQFSALVSFAYNIGLGALQTSTLLEDVNAGNWHFAADEFLKWDKAGGVVLPGLTARRQAERALFLMPV